jgi:hypothetical protein
MYRAYDALSDGMKVYLDGLTALHDGRDIFGEGTPSASHPVVVTHPDSGRKLIYVNGAFTKRINELPEQESDAVLKFLCQHCARPEWSFRFRWAPHSIAMWDNRCAQHFAVSDYLPNVRSGFRVQIDGTSRINPQSWSWVCTRSQHRSSNAPLKTAVMRRRLAPPLRMLQLPLPGAHRPGESHMFSASCLCSLRRPRRRDEI